VPSLPVSQTAIEIEYVIQDRPLGAVGVEKRESLRLSRNSALLVDVTVGLQTWSTDEEFKRKLANMILRMSRGRSGPARLKGTSGPEIVAPTLNQLDAIEDAIFAQENSVQDRFDARIETLQTATTVSEINAITW
jgi:hypothetical protein